MGNGEEKEMRTQDVGYAEPVEVSDAKFDVEVLKSSVPVLLDCWAPWCGPCQRMTPVMHQLAQYLAGEVKVAKLNVDQNPAVSHALGIQSVPTLLLFRQGKAIGQLLGAAPAEQIATAVRARLKDWTGKV
jgi:thioredoxin 2